MIELLAQNVSQGLTTISTLHVKALRRLGISTIRDLIFYAPKDYKIKRLYPDCSNCQSGDIVIIKGILQTQPLAVLKVDYKGLLPYVKFGDSNTLRVGDPVVVIGNPFGLGGTVTCGIVSNKSRNIESPSNSIGGFIQTDAAINKGNSGGPMFNMHGHVVGVNFAIFSPSGTNAGIGFAIPSSYAKNIVEQLMNKGKIERGALSIRGGRILS